MTRDVRICVVGDSFVTGFGDPKALGWTGRVIARTRPDEVDLTLYDLGVRGDSSADVLSRWREETARRWREGCDNRLVVAMGTGDVDGPLTIARSRLNLANIVDAAMAQGLSPFVVGPPPALDQDFNGRLEHVVTAQQDVCSRRSVPYVDCLHPLLTHEQWYSDLAAGDGLHPGAAGYGLLAWLVLHSGWGRWLGVDTD